MTICNDLHLKTAILEFSAQSALINYVMLSKGLEQYFAHNEKEQLFQDAKNISDLLVAIMDRRTKERKATEVPPK